MLQHKYMYLKELLKKLYNQSTLICMLKMVIQKSVYIVQMLLNMDGWMSLKIKLSPLKWLYATGMVKLITLDVYYRSQQTV